MIVYGLSSLYSFSSWQKSIYKKKMQHNNVFRIVLILNGNRMKQDYTTIAETQGRALQGKRCSLLFAELQQTHVRCYDVICIERHAHQTQHLSDEKKRSWTHSGTRMINRRPSFKKHIRQDEPSLETPIKGQDRYRISLGWEPISVKMPEVVRYKSTLKVSQIEEALVKDRLSLHENLLIIS